MTIELGGINIFSRESVAYVLDWIFQPVIPLIRKSEKCGSLGNESSYNEDPLSGKCHRVNVGIPFVSIKNQGIIYRSDQFHRERPVHIRFRRIHLIALFGNFSIYYRN